MFSPPLIAVLGGAIEGHKTEEVNGERFKMLFAGEEGITVGADSFFGFGLLPLSIGVAVDGGVFKKALYQFQKLPVSNAIKVRPCNQDQEQIVITFLMGEHVLSEKNQPFEEVVV